MLIRALELGMLCYECRVASSPRVRCSSFFSLRSFFFFLKWRLCGIAKEAGKVSNNNSHAVLDGLELERAVKMMESCLMFSRDMWRF
ncbi:hypothetical protein I7I48_04639 [Histoplasma ohiense]|nr:hypothetical protein I7I48_04639 [Histoplasma ohiense (nom. inval.)]